MRSVLWLLSTLLVSPALAVVPHERLPQGSEPVVPRTFDPGMQRFGEALPAWRRFTQDEGQGWTMRFDGLSRVPHRMWGRGIDVGPVHTADDAAQAALAFADRHAELLGVAQAGVSVRAAHRTPEGSFLVDLQVHVDDLPLWRSILTFRFAHGRLVMVGSSAWPHAHPTGVHALSSEAAAEALVQELRVLGQPDVQHVTAMWLPEVRGGKAALRPVWVVRAHTSGVPPGQWVGFVDATSAEIVAFYNEVRFAEGQLFAEVDGRPLGDPWRRVVPLPRATIRSADDGGSEVRTDEDGWWTLEVDDPSEITVALEGPRVLLRDSLQEVADVPIPAGEHVVIEEDLGPPSPDRLASLSAFVAVQEAQEQMRQYAPGLDWNLQQIDTTVNIDDACNAWFDGTINFLRAGQGCANTARVIDVVYHEWGHGFHAFGLRAGFFDGSLGEGAADVVSMLVTDESGLAPGFFEGSDRPLRELANTRRYPEDFRPGQANVHSNGLIFGGAVWDLRQILSSRLGDAPSKATVGRLFTKALSTGPDIPSSYDEFVFADDDDADLSNGTPHLCEIVDAFGRHGLGPAGGSSLTATHTHAAIVQPGVGKPVRFALPNPAPECVDVRPVGGTLFWAPENAAGWSTLPLSASDTPEAVIPTEDLPPGTLIHYWARLRTVSGAEVLAPTGGPIRPWSQYVGDVLPVYCNDFEEDDGGFTHELLAGVDQPGADDWMWGRPNGDGGDPDHAASGVNVWGNDLGGFRDGQRYDGLYQPNIHNRLTTPPLSTHHYEGVFLHYSRWLQVEDGLYDRSSLYADGRQVWTNWATSEDNGRDHHLEDAWVTHVVDLQGQADDGEVVLAWDLRSDEGLEFGGWTLDDVCLFAPDTPDNRLGISDLVGVRTDRGVTLSWTQPRHGPVEEVRVVRTRGRWPTGPEDGRRVWSSVYVRPGATGSILDTGGSANTYYAVYAFDGEHWLSWTRPDFNAIAIDPRGGEPAPLERTGCGGGCASGSTSPLPWVFGAAASLVLRRRRRARFAVA